jgi:regulator of extracellular matrix RemA (YlzA/DUF370 family)
MPSILFNVGYSNFINAERVVGIINPNSVPAKRMRDEAREQGILVDATTGHRVRSMIVTSSKHVIVSSLEVVTLVARYNEACQDFIRHIGLKRLAEQQDSSWEIPVVEDDDDVAERVVVVIPEANEESPKRQRVKKPQEKPEEKSQEKLQEKSPEPPEDPSLDLVT